MKAKDFYTQSHLLVAAIRIYEHGHSEPPPVDAVCKTLEISLEQGHLICKKLDEMEIIEMVKGPYGTRLFIRDHLKIEEIPKDEPGTSLQEEIEKFQSTKKDYKEKIEAFQAKKEEARRDLFARIEEKLKQAKGI
ncbi:MAG: hypothetical protein V2I97_03275 [Desulfococcaceae bacterium]|jgi:hypothetical protein|nr:hypothetical protein [Desulfococcaceae bacterium]